MPFTLHHDEIDILQKMDKREKKKKDWKESVKMKPSLEKLITTKCKFPRKITKFFKESYGNVWFDQFEKNFFSGLDLQNVYSLCSCFGRNIPRHCDIFYGIFFNPLNWKKGTKITCSINCHTYDGKNAQPSSYVWSLTLNNEDGFYPYCFGDFGVFPTLAMQCCSILLSVDQGMMPTYQYSILGFNLGLNDSLRKKFAKEGVMISRPPYIIGNFSMCAQVNPHDRFELFYEPHPVPNINNWMIIPVDVPRPYLEWNSMDWAANRIKRALREYVQVMKRRTYFS